MLTLLIIVAFAVPQEPAPTRMPALPDVADRARWFGTWTQDFEASSSRPGANPYRRVTLTIAPRTGSTEGIEVRYDMVGTRGGRTHMEWRGAFDGADYPVQGVDYVLTNAYFRISETAYRIVVKVDGVEVARTEVAISEDASTMTGVTTEAGPQRPATTTAVYRRAPD